MTPLRFIFASLRHFRRIHLAVAAGVAVATAVLTGALLVGDSVRGSLRELTLERLGNIDSALVATHFFREALASEVGKDDGFQSHFTAAEPAILMTGTLQSGSGQKVRRATQVSLVGCREDFWSLGKGGPKKPLAPNEVALTEPLARELGINIGDAVLVRVPAVSVMPSDSVLGEKSEISRSRSFSVAEILPTEGIARFDLAPSQHAPRNAFLPLQALQQVVEQPGKANAILVATGYADAASDVAAQRSLKNALKPTAEDYGLAIKHLESPTPAVQIASGQLVLPPDIVRAAESAFGKGAVQPVVTYLANTIRIGDGGSARTIPYSTITGVDSTAELGPLRDDAGQPVGLADDEIALNRWAADDLNAKIGDIVTITFYEPESAHGQLREHEPESLRLAHIAGLRDADGTPTGAADPALTPELPGVTDQDSINDWELPFELVETIRGEDENYWDEHRTTPKAFVSLDTAKRLWPSRWGTISLLRLPTDTADGKTASAAGNSSTSGVETQLLAQIDPAEVGMAFVPIKAQGLAAASGTTPFDGLFLSFSFFLIAAAVMLIALLFQLGIEQRASELGILAAAGVPRRRITRLLSQEGLVVAAIGSLIGVAAGVLYAWLMISGLRTWWVSAIATPFLELHVSPRSLAIGWLTGVIVSWLVIRWSIRRLVRLPAGGLLVGRTRGSETIDPNHSGAWESGRIWTASRNVLVALTIALVILGFRVQSEAQAGAFFGSGSLMLMVLLGEIRHRLRAASHSGSSHRGFNLFSLSAHNIARNPGRSALTIALVASASFLILAISAFRLETSDAGTGGLELLATSDQPIHFDLNTPEGRLELGFSDEDSDKLAKRQIYSLRVAAGEDASCLNLYRPTQPRVLGVPPALIERDGFAWGAVADANDDETATNPWKLLNRELGDDVAGRLIVPVVLDMSTAYYSLHLSGIGARLEIQDGADMPVTLEVVGLLKNSVLQGNLLVSEANFLRLFPEVGGYQMFLISPAHDRDDSDSSAAGLLETTLAAEGFDAVDAREQLAGYLAVQNTYLSTFQSIGLLGLLLGTVGLAIVQLRSVLERRSELALMRASGFRRRRLVQMVVCENAMLLVSGLAVGSMAAAVATLSQWARYDADVPWTSLVALLGVIALVGLGAGWLATRSALRAPLLPALRGD